MKNTTIYSPKILKLFRIFGIIAIGILLISIINRFVTIGLENFLLPVDDTVTITINIIVMIILFFFVLYPYKLGLCAISTAIYAIIIIFFEPMNMMGILMYFLTVSLLYVRGYYNKGRRSKNIITTIIFLSLIASEYRFGNEIFIQALIEKIGFSFIIFLILYFSHSYFSELMEKNSSEKKLDIQDYPELKKRDAEWLHKIILGEKYEAIAIESCLSLGSVKNRAKVIFSELGVGDRHGFLNKYSEFDICYGDEYFSNHE